MRIYHFFGCKIQPLQDWKHQAELVEMLYWRPFVSESLKTSESLLLDVIRVSAALVVIIGHISQRYFSTQWPDLIILSRAAVGVFFVLSGFVIRYVTSRRTSTCGNYFRDRISRIYSVAIPALIFTLIADLVSHRANPGFYAYWAGASSHPIARILSNLSFTAQLWTLDISPLSNSPFWSLNYEFIYYLLYGFTVYLGGRKRWICIALTVAIAGPKIIVLYPVWLIGCYAHDLYQSWNALGKTNTYINRISATFGFIALLLCLAVFLDRSIIHAFAVDRHELYIMSLRMHLGRTGGSVGFYMVGIIGSLLLLRLLEFARRFDFDPKSKYVIVIRFISEGTFPIYLFHFPFYVLVAACIPYNHASSVAKCSIVFVAFGLGILAGHPCNMLKKRMRFGLTEIGSLIRRIAPAAMA